MSYGLRIRNAAGSPVLDVVDEITRFRYGTAVSAGVSDHVGLADISGKKSVEISVMTENACKKVAHSIVRSGSGAGTTISWTAQAGVRYDSANSALYSFLYT